MPTLSRTLVRARAPIGAALVPFFLSRGAACQVTPFSHVTAELAVRSAASSLDRLAAQAMHAAGERYVTPHLVPYDSTMLTPCGRAPADNAMACRVDGNIYYDRALLARLAAGAAASLHTDGTTAAVAVVAHEWGHVLQYQMALDYRDARVRSEPDADCLAGVLLGRARAEGRLRDGDMAEAEFATAAVGDAPMVGGDWGRAIEAINASGRAGNSGYVPTMTNAWGNHGNARERLAAFRRGLTSDVRTCTAGIARLGLPSATQALPAPTTTPGAPPTIRWFVDRTGDAYDLAVQEGKPVVFVYGIADATYFLRLKHEVLGSPELARLAPYAIFVYADPAHDVVTRNFGKALGYERSPVISLLAPNPTMLDEVTRLVGLFDAPTVAAKLTEGLQVGGWLQSPRAPWLPPRPAP